MVAIQHAVPNFDPAGRFNYTKLADLYLQNMVDLESHKDWVFEKIIFELVYLFHIFLKLLVSY